jgi:hypothetical protein
MFIPKGTWHDVISMDQRSLHLTVSLVYPTVADFVTWGMQQNRYGVPFADIRGDAACIATLPAQCSRFMADLITEDNIHRFLRFHRSGHACSRVKADFPLLNRPSRESRYRRIPSDVMQVDQRPGIVVAYALGRTHELSVEECALLQRLPHVGGVHGYDLAPTDEAWSAMAPLLQVLLEIGLVGKDAGTWDPTTRRQPLHCHWPLQK